ncbi:MAG: dynamin family protein [Candidatus Muiribacteriota bacterium]
MQSIDKEKYIKKFDELEGYFKKYEIQDNDFEKILEDIRKYKVAVLLVGPFSSGKTTMLNILLGKKILGLGLSPKTSIPAELTFGESNEYSVVLNDGSFEALAEEDIKKGYDINKYNYFSLKLNNEFLKSVKNLLIVDMPGFDSGIDLHDRAIDNYIEKSRAYIVVNDLKKGTIKKSILDILAELNILNKPVYCLISKSDKDLSAVESTVSLTQKKIEEIIKLESIDSVSSKNKNIEPFKNFLLEINSKADSLFKNEFTRIFISKKKAVLNYLSIRLKNFDKDFTELEIEEEKYEKELESLNNEFDDACIKISDLYDKTVKEIQASLQEELMNRSDRYAQSALNGGDVKNDINLVIRRVYLEKIKNYFEPKMIKFFEPLQNQMSSLENIDLSVSLEDSMEDIAVINSIQGLIASILKKIKKEISEFTAAIIGMISDFFFGKAKKAKQLEEAKSKMRLKIHEIIPSVTVVIESNKDDILEKIYETIKKDINARENLIHKAMGDLRLKREKEEDEQNKIKESLKNDLNLIELM